MKLVLKITGIVVVVILLAAGFFAYKFWNMAKTLSSYKITEVNLNEINDGVYAGKYGKFLVSVDLEITVKDHKIGAVKILKQDCGPGYDARQITDRVIQAQSLKVDAVTGATGSSKCILIAMHKALSRS